MNGRVEVWRGIALGRACLFPPLSSGGALVARPWLRFHTPLIEPDVRISRIRLSDKTSRLRPRHVVPKPAQAYEPEVPVEVREWVAPAPSSPDFVLGAQPPAQPHRCVSVERPIRLADGSYLEVVRPPAQRAVHFPVLRALSLCTCCRHYPGAATGRRLRSSHPAVSAFPDNVVGSACTSSFSRSHEAVVASGIWQHEVAYHPLWRRPCKT